MDKPVSRSRAVIVMVLLSGLVFHDFVKIEAFKLGAITITYLRVILIVTIPLLIFPKVKLFNKDRIAVAFFLFMIYGLARIGGNYKQAFALYCTMVAFFFLYISIENARLAQKCTNMLAVLLIVLCAIGVIEVTTGYHFRETMVDAGVTEAGRFAAGVYYNPNDFSALLAVLVMYMLLSNFDRITKISVIVVAMLIITINKSQICLLGLLSFILIAFVLKNRVNRTLRFAVMLMLAAALALPVYSMIQDSSFNHRAYMYRFGIKNCRQHLWLGLGIGNYAKGMDAVGFTPYVGTSADPHNLFLELIGQFGIIWGILLLLLLVKLLCWFFKRINEPGNLIRFGLVYLVPFVGLSSSSCMEKNYIYLALLVPLVYYRMFSEKTVLSSPVFV